MRTKISLQTMYSGTIEAVTKLILIAFVIFVAGCVSISQKSGYEEDAAERIIPNETTSAAVMDILGPPDSFTEDNEFITYTYKIEEKKIDIILPNSTPNEIVKEFTVNSVRILDIKINATSKIVSSIEKKDVE